MLISFTHVNRLNRLANAYLSSQSEVKCSVALCKWSLVLLFNADVEKSPAVMEQPVLKYGNFPFTARSPEPAKDNIKFMVNINNNINNLGGGGAYYYPC